MNILIVSATAAEIKPLADYLQPYRVEERRNSYKRGNVSFLLRGTGVGSVATIYHIGKCLAEQPFDIAIQAGIAGSFSKHIPLGSVWRISSDTFAGDGAEDNGKFLDLFDLGFLKENEFPFEQKWLPAGASGISALDKLPLANAITVHAASGNEHTIHQLKEKYRPSLESMEGAAFHYVCRMEKLQFIQIRSISNYVEVRDKSKWNIPLAISRLNEVLIQSLQELSSLCQ